MILHAPGSELGSPGPGQVAIDVPGHGLSSDYSNIIGAIGAVAEALGAKSVQWPHAPKGHAGELYPDLKPDRSGTHLAKAWSVARAQVLFDPWYAADKDHALPVNAALLEPATIAFRARALLRAGPAARRWHDTLVTLEGDELS
jgi:hypothetical protein